MKTYKDIDKIPSGSASELITPGALVLEGGGWKGLYTAGVLDAMMEEHVNLSSVVGVSAGALCSLCYVAGQIGWSARINLSYRHDTNYCGLGAFRRDHGITGFSYLFDTILKVMPLDEKRLFSPNRRLAVSATNLQTGKVVYFEKGHCDLYRAVQASASVPYISEPVLIDGVPYLDGGCAEKIPYPWAEQCGEKKIVVVRTRDAAFRRKSGAPSLAEKAYRNYPEFVRSLKSANDNYNTMADALQADADSGKIYMISPSKPINVKRFDGNMEKLGELYWLGYHDAHSQMKDLKAFLKF